MATLCTRWFNGVEMRTPRYDAGVCVKEGVIYVCGGFDGSNFLRSVEALVSNIT